MDWLFAKRGDADTDMSLLLSDYDILTLEDFYKAVVEKMLFDDIRAHQRDECSCELYLGGHGLCEAGRYLDALDEPVNFLRDADAGAVKQALIDVLEDAGKPFFAPFTDRSSTKQVAM
jgi:hypothetical protein